MSVMNGHLRGSFTNSPPNNARVVRTRHNPQQINSSMHNEGRIDNEGQPSVVG